MAFTKSTKTAHGFDAINAYHRVEAVSINEKNSITFHVRIYKEAGLPFFDEKVMSAPYNLEGANPIKQAYLYIKTLPEFEDVVDC
jgi:hypothetical protein